ncbi:MAG: GIDE domain-containing protein, partial [Miltoncostaeaceae bacterium]
APASGRECVWYRLVISERHREVHRDSKGNTRPRIVERQVSEERSHDAFAVADASGRVLVDPDGADIDDPVETVDRVESVSSGAGMNLSLGTFTFNIGGSSSLVGVRTREHILPVGEELYALAGAGQRDGHAVLGRPNEGAFVVSTRSSDELEKRARRVMWAWTAAVFLGSAAGAALIVGGLMS